MVIICVTSTNKLKQGKPIPIRLDTNIVNMMDAEYTRNKNMIRRLLLEMRYLIIKRVDIGDINLFRKIHGGNLLNYDYQTFKELLLHCIYLEEYKRIYYETSQLLLNEEYSKSQDEDYYNILERIPTKYQPPLFIYWMEEKLNAFNKYELLNTDHSIKIMIYIFENNYEYIKNNLLWQNYISIALNHEIFVVNSESESLLFNPLFYAYLDTLSDSYIFIETFDWFLDHYQNGTELVYFCPSRGDYYKIINDDKLSISARFEHFIQWWEMQYVIINDSFGSPTNIDVLNAFLEMYLLKNHAIRNVNDFCQIFMEMVYYVEIGIQRSNTTYPIYVDGKIISTLFTASYKYKSLKSLMYIWQICHDQKLDKMINDDGLSITKKIIANIRYKFKTNKIKAKMSVVENMIHKIQRYMTEYQQNDGRFQIDSDDSRPENAKETDPKSMLNQDCCVCC